MVNSQTPSLKQPVTAPPVKIPSSRLRLPPAAAKKAIKRFFAAHRPSTGQLLVITDERGKRFALDPSSLDIFHASDRSRNRSLDLLAFDTLVFSVHACTWNPDRLRFITGPLVNQLTLEIIRPPFTVRRNPEENGIEVFFSHEPPGSVKDALYKAGFRYSSRLRLWYAIYTIERLETAKQVVQGSISRDFRASRRPGKKQRRFSY